MYNGHPFLLGINGPYDDAFYFTYAPHPYLAEYYRNSTGFGLVPQPVQGRDWFPEFRQERQFQAGPERPGQRPPYPHVVNWTAQYPDDVIAHGPEDRKQVALTFDDGPDGTWTPQILSILRQYQIRATFMCVGMMVRAYPAVLQNIVRQGHVVGNHTWDHPHLPMISPSQVRSELSRTKNEIERVAAVRPRLFRPPYGQLDDSVIREIVEMDYKIILWNVDSLCWAGLSGPQIAANVLAHIRPGAIVLMHSAGGVSRAPTVQALPYIIEVLRAEGYTFATVSELLDIAPYEPAD